MYGRRKMYKVIGKGASKKYQANLRNFNMTNTKILASASAENIGEIYKTNILAGSSAFVADEPKEFGGGETGPCPGGLSKYGR